MPSATPANRFFAFSHVLDGGWTGHHLDRSWELLKLNEFGPIVNVDHAAPPYGNTHRLVTAADVKNDARRAHGSVVPGGAAVKDASGRFIHENVWRYLFTHPVEQVGQPVPSDPACRKNPTVSSASKPVAGARTYDLAFSTFFGKKMDCRGMTVDAQGNVYLAGSTWDAECPTTEGAYDRTFHGEADMAISKWSPEGKLLWSTLVGSPGHDRPYSVKVDSQGCVYAAGIGGVGMPVSPDAFQPKPLARTKNVKIPGEEYVGANGYIVKLSPDGSKVLWGSYVGNNIECRDLAIDDEDNLYLTFGWLKDSAGDLPASWFANAYCKRPHAGRTPPGRVEDLGRDEGLQRREEGLLGDLHRRHGRERPGGEPLRRPRPLPGRLHRHLVPRHADDSRRFQRQAQVLLAGQVLRRRIEADLRDLPGAGKISVPRTHDVAMDSSGNIFATFSVDGTWPATPGAFQRKYGGGNTDFGIVKLSPTGKLLACTYLGGSGDEINGPDTLSVGKDGSVLITSGWGTTSPDYPVTAGCFQPSLHGKNNAFFSLLSNDLGTLLYSTYMGGQGRTSAPTPLARTARSGWPGTRRGRMAAEERLPERPQGRPGAGQVLARFLNFQGIAMTCPFRHHWMLLTAVVAALVMPFALFAAEPTDEELLAGPMRGSNNAARQTRRSWSSMRRANPSPGRKSTWNKHAMRFFSAATSSAGASCPTTIGSRPIGSALRSC